MLGGINNVLFLQSLSGFFVLAIFILFLKWAFPTKRDPVAKQGGRGFKKSLLARRRK